jgi:hypothetical protein
MNARSIYGKLRIPRQERWLLGKKSKKPVGGNITQVIGKEWKLI